MEDLPIPHKDEGEGYYSLKSNEASMSQKYAAEADDPVETDPNEPERVSDLQPLKYEYRANNNFFGGRTTFYTQVGSAAYYNEDAGLWMGPSALI